MSLNNMDYLHYNKLDGSISTTITFCRFPMAILVMLLHSSFEFELIEGKSIFEGWEAPLYHHLDYILARNICDIAVPLFFLISGFLFFKESKFTIDLYKIKIKKRIKSLLIPYLLWNLIIFLLYLIVQNVAPAMNSGRNKMIADYETLDYLKMFWSMSSIQEHGLSGPIDTPLWFIRDLMIMIILSPIIYYVIKKTKILLPIITLTIFVLGLYHQIPGFSSKAIAFFSLGTYFSLYKIDFVFLAKKIVIYTIFLYFLLLIGLTLMKDNGIQYVWIKNLLVVIGVIFAVGLVSKMIDSNGWMIPSFLTSSTFFIFAGHMEILKVFVRLASRLGIQNDLYYCIMHFVCPLLTLILLLFIYRILLKFIPSVATLLSGGR